MLNRKQRLFVRKIKKAFIAILPFAVLIVMLGIIGRMEANTCLSGGICV